MHSACYYARTAFVYTTLKYCSFQLPQKLVQCDVEKGNMKWVVSFLGEKLWYIPLMYILVLAHQELMNVWGFFVFKNKINSRKHTAGFYNWNVGLSSHLIYKIEPLELGDKMSMTILQLSVHYSCSSSWRAFKVLTQTIETTYLPLKPESRKITSWTFALPSGMAFNAVDRSVCCSLSS